MSWISRLFSTTATLEGEARERELARLDAKRRHLRGKTSQLSTKIRRAWTDYRNWSGDAKGKKSLRVQIKRLEAERKELSRQMGVLQARLERLGAQVRNGADAAA